MGFFKRIFGRPEPTESFDHEAFWDWFRANERAFAEAVRDRSRIESGFFAYLAPQLARVGEGIYYLVGTLEDGTTDLIFTADGVIKNFARVEDLVASAPEIPGWQFRAHKPPHGSAEFGLVLDGLRFDSAGLSFFPIKFDAYPDEISIAIVFESYDEEKHEAIEHGVYLFLDNYLGELTFASDVDSWQVVGPESAAPKTYPIVDLAKYLDDQKSKFNELREQVRHDTENDRYVLGEGEDSGGTPFVCLVNADLAVWDSKPSHPWMVRIDLTFDGGSNNGMPDDRTTVALNSFENSVAEKLPDVDGYLNVGRITGGGERSIYFACKEFRNPSRVLDACRSDHSDLIGFDFHIYKDKYWRSTEGFAGS